MIEQITVRKPIKSLCLVKGIFLGDVPFNIGQTHKGGSQFLRVLSEGNRDDECPMLRACCQNRVPHGETTKDRFLTEGFDLSSAER
jgi:GH24 family phage-related lysozyme (muramidase)